MSSFTSRLLGGFGRLLITLGLLVLLFAAFQHWGTNLAEAQAQDELDAEFTARLRSLKVPDHEIQSASAASTSDPASSTSASDTAVADSSPLIPPPSAVSHPILDLADIPKVSEAAGRILIPAIGVDKTYVQGVGRDDLRKGPGHYPQTPFPGQPGNSAIAGHRTTYGAPFHDLDNLAPGDEIVVETLQGRFTYIVEGHQSADGATVGYFIVSPTDTWVLDDKGDNRLTLTACHPKRSAAQRIIVTATLDSSPAPSTPIPVEAVQPGQAELPTEDIDGSETIDESQSFEASLDWQPQYSGRTALWGAAAALVALGGWWLGRRWRRGPAYALAAGPFLVCLFFCFTFLDKLLPPI
ncbi:MAG: class E sortase [Acidimicrobiia bacterium]|nr:class E sortase [Acidimicrobiia bacterium]